jgi:galactokinase
VTDLLRARFAALAGRPPAVLADAPGRVNLIGEHTDYNGGLVLPLATPQRTRVALAARGDGRVRLTSAEMGDGVVEYALGAETRRGDWPDYVQGVTQVLAAAGHALGGFDLAVASEVPVGSGLSSSAALEIAVMRGLQQLFALDLADPREMATLARRAENDFVGAPVGIMDQMAALLAGERVALFLDVRGLAYERLPLPDAADIAVVHSGVTHDHASGDYRVRRAECDRAAALLGVRELRDVPASALAAIERLPGPLDRRTRHVVTEIARVESAREALRAGRLEELGRLMNASHASMRDDFEISTPEIDGLVEAARAHPATYGARLTGGGFGGCLVILTAAGEAGRVGRAVAATSPAGPGHRPRLVVPPASDARPGAEA